MDVSVAPHRVKARPRQSASQSGWLHTSQPQLGSATIFVVFVPQQLQVARGNKFAMKRLKYLRCHGGGGGSDSPQPLASQGEE